jgi:hypothetical protein
MHLRCYEVWSGPPDSRTPRSRRVAGRVGLATVLADRVARFGRVDRNVLRPMHWRPRSPCQTLHIGHRIGPRRRLARASREVKWLVVR